MTTRRIGAWDVVRRLGAEDAASARGSESFLVRPSGAASETFALHRVIEPGRPLDALQAKLERFAKLRHSALPPVADCFVDGDAVAVVIAHDKGMALDQLQENLARDHDELDDAGVWFVGAEIAGALAIGHAARDAAGDLAPFVHGALTARHVLVTKEGGVRLRGYCPGVMVHPSGRGSDAAWVAPETRRGERTSTSVDAYGVALLVHSLLTGKSPAVARTPIPIRDARSDVPRDVADLIDGMLDRGQGERPSCAELSHRFGALVEGQRGQDALQESLELYRALTGLFSISAPELEAPSEEPLLLSQKLPEIEPVAGLIENLDESAPSTTESVGTEPPPDEEEEEEDDEENEDAAAPRAPFSEPGLGSTLVSRFDVPDLDDDEEADEEEEGSADEDPEDDGRVEAVGDEDDAEEQAVGDEPAPSPAELEVYDVDARAAEADTPASMRFALFAVVGVAVGLVAWWLTRQTPPAPTPDPAISAARSASVPSPPAVPSATAATVPSAIVPSDVPTPAPSAPSSAPSASAAPPTVAPERASPAAAGMEEGPAVYESLADPLEVGLFQAKLIVRSPIDAEVFVQGVGVGRTNAENVVSCGWRNVRLGEKPAGTEWLTKGKPIDIHCRERTRVTLVPDEE